VDDSLTIGRKAREHYNRLTARYEMMHQTDYRKHFFEHWRKHPVHPMTVTPHVSLIK
jgi:hypothetical protein